MKTSENEIVKVYTVHRSIITVTVAKKRREYFLELTGVKRKVRIKVPCDPEAPATITDLNGNKICRAFPRHTKTEN